MKNLKNLFSLFSLLMIVGLTGCTNDYSNGERIGYITQYSETGLLIKTQEGHLNVTQTGMNTGASFDFSVDRDNSQAKQISEQLEVAAQQGYKVKLTYNQSTL